MIYHDIQIELNQLVAKWLACWTQAQKGPGSNRSRDAVEYELPLRFLHTQYTNNRLIALNGRMGSVPGTINFSCQSATSIFDATLLLYAVFIDLNRF